jgi:hypothetical protein
MQLEGRHFEEMVMYILDELPMIPGEWQQEARSLIAVHLKLEDYYSGCAELVPAFTDRDIPSARSHRHGLLHSLERPATSVKYPSELLG